MNLDVFLYLLVKGLCDLASRSQRSRFRSLYRILRAGGSTPDTGPHSRIRAFVKAAHATIFECPVALSPRRWFTEKREENFSAFRAQREYEKAEGIASPFHLTPGWHALDPLKDPPESAEDEWPEVIE
jgi:hypothetical protein